MVLGEAPKKAFNVGAEVTAWSVRLSLAAAATVIEKTALLVHAQLETAEELVGEIQEDIPANTAIVGAEMLEKADQVEVKAGTKLAEVAGLELIEADPDVVDRAVDEQKGLETDAKTLKIGAFALMGRAIHEVITEAVPPDVETTVLDIAVHKGLDPSQLPVPPLEQELMALRLKGHKDFMGDEQ